MFWIPNGLKNTVSARYLYSNQIIVSHLFIDNGRLLRSGRVSSEPISNLGTNMSVCLFAVCTYTKITNINKNIMYRGRKVSIIKINNKTMNATEYNAFYKLNVKLVDRSAA